VLIAALFTIAKILNQSKCLPMDEWINKNMAYKHNEIKRRKSYHL
jgi:hypothetical protein